MIFLLLVLMQDPAALSDQGASAMRGGRFAEAEKAYRELIRLDPANPMWKLNLGLALHSEGKFQEAVASFETFLKVRPAPGPAHFMLGASRLKLGKACDAIAPLETARRWKSSRDILLQLGDASYGCQRYTAAAEAYLKAGDSRLAARAYWQARQYPEASTLFRSIEKQYSDEAEFNYEFGDTLTRMSGAAAGLPYLEAAVRLKPALVAARGELGKALAELGRDTDAIPHLEAAAAQDPALLLPLSRAYRNTGRSEDAARAQDEYRKRVAGN